ncbi:MAG: adenylate/guanylate cyclase domain-containing protein [Gammaproteobacteria bacterium]
MTFRARLLQAIVGVVAITTGASLYFAERQSRASYGTVVDALFRQQTAAFQREQEGRHALAAEQVARLATSVRLFAALEARDPQVYKIAGDELRLGDFKAFRLLDADGVLIAPPPDGRAGILDPEALLPRLVPSTRIDQTRAGAVELGFVVDASAAAEQSPLYRVLAAPIVNFARRVGTLVLVQHLQRFSPQNSRSDTDEDLQSALWLDGRLVGGDFSVSLRDALRARLANAPADLRRGTLEVAATSYRFQRALLNEGSAYPPAWLVSIFSMAAFEAQQRELIIRLVLTGISAALLATLLGIALSRQLARPIRDLVEATHKIRRGEYDLSLPPAATQEMNNLAEAFNEMSAGLALKDRYHSLLTQVADPQIAAELVAGRVRLGGELREVTVMFCDIREYTALTIGRAPAAVIEILNGHLGAMAHLVHTHGGVINQFAGDAIMALFGAPRSYGDDALRAVRCAIDMLHERELLNTTAPLPLHIGIGIASGAMVAGCIGAENRSDYTVVGERVNLAARLCDAASPGAILIDDATRVRVGAMIATTALAPITLKGFTEPTRAFRVVVDEEAA